MTRRCGRLFYFWLVQRTQPSFLGMFLCSCWACLLESVRVGPATLQSGAAAEYNSISRWDRHPDDL